MKLKTIFEIIGLIIISIPILFLGISLMVLIALILIQIFGLIVLVILIPSLFLSAHIALKLNKAFDSREMIL